MYKKSKARAKKIGLEFDLELSDIVIPDVCPILGISLVRGRDSGLDTSPSVDRIDNDKGYIKGNVHVISGRANRLKGDSTIEELDKLIKYLRRL